MDTVYWKNSLLKRITILELYEVDETYKVGCCYGITEADEIVIVKVPFKTIEKGTIKQTIMKFARDENVYVKGLGIFESVSISL